MYKEKGDAALRHTTVRIENEEVELGFDGFTGDLTRLVAKSTGDNLIKNWHEARSMPFCLELKNRDGSVEKVTSFQYNFLLTHMHLKPEISTRELPDGTRVFSAGYSALMGKDSVRDIKLTYSVMVSPHSRETIWKIKVRNLEKDSVVKAVLFPCVFGVYLGDTWKDDVLIYPFNAGEKVENPVELYEQEPAIIGWKWQEYKYVYHINGIGTQRMEDGAYAREFKYSGPASMMWLDYYDSQNGLYLASYDECFPVSAIHAETFGGKRPGMGFFTVKYPEIQPGEEWESAPFALAVHEGDWHWGAERYRTWRESCTGEAAVKLPEWFKKSAGLVAHYDFKYQDGEVVHHFTDIPSLYKQAKEFGLDHILISGWHKDGFDHGFPMYTPDTEVGTEDELASNVKSIKEAGGHVTFYVNSQLCNVKYEELEDLRNHAGVMGEDGKINGDNYGDKEIGFSVMCCQAERWRKHLANAVEYLIDKAGADGVYLDQLGMAKPQFCYNQQHNHHPSSWNEGYKKLLKEINSKYESSSLPSIFYEGVSDIHGNQVCGQLISTFFYYHNGAFPEMYKYTFPEQVLVDMVYPSRNQIMRPVHVSQVSREMINKAFILGSYFWIYDLEEDNTFSKDPEQMGYLKQVIRLRKFWLESFGRGIFRDTVGLEFDPGILSAKRYEMNDGAALIAVWNPGRTPADIRISNVCCGSIHDRQINYKCYEIEADFAVNRKSAALLHKDGNCFSDVETGGSELSIIVVGKCGDA